MTLSSRAIAFSVDNLLHSPTPSHSHEPTTPKTDHLRQLDVPQESDVRIKHELIHETVSTSNPSPAHDAQSNAAGNLISDRASQTSSAKTPESCEDHMTSCFCHGEMSFCMHPGMVTVTDRHGSGTSVSAELLHSDLWFKFHRLGTEMIITKSGRRMFPSLKLRVNGLDPGKTYETRLEFLQPDCKKYRYIYHSSRWMVSGSGDALPSIPSHLSPESPLHGQAICSQVLSFERLKLTNSEHTRQGQVSLVSMQKFQPQVVIEEVQGSCGSKRTAEVYQIIFPQTSFMAVTAYQNQQITTLKIASNPFAKGFRDSGKLRYPYDGKPFSQPHSPGTDMGLTGYDASRLFPTQGHSILESLESRFGRKRSHLNPWELETGEKTVKAMKFDIFNSSPSLPLLLQPHFGVSPYLASGYAPSSPEHTVQQNMIRHDVSPFRHNGLILRENSLPLANYLSTFSSPSSSAFTSSSYSPVTLRDIQTLPTACQIHKNHNDVGLLTLRHCSSSSSLNSSSSTISGNFSEKNRRSSEVKQELDCDQQRPNCVDAHHENNSLIQKKDLASNKPPHQIMHLENLNEVNDVKPLMPVNNFAEIQHSRNSFQKSETKTLQAYIRNDTVCNTVCSSVPNLNESLKLIPYLYRHPFGVHGQCQTEQIFGHP